MLFFLCGSAFAVFGIACLIVAYFVGYGSLQKKKRCSSKTSGKVIGMSKIAYNDIRPPLVEYSVNGTVYRVAGPKFAASVTRSFTIAGKDMLQSGTNVTEDGPLPDVAVMTAGASATEQALQARYPVGTTVDVYYDPNKPKRSYVERYVPIPAAFGLWIPLVLGILLLLCAIIVPMLLILFPQ